MSFGGHSGGGSSNQSQQFNYGRFPGEFVSDAGKVVGQPLTISELLAGMPQVTGLFSGGTAGPPATLAPSTGTSATFGSTGPAGTSVAGSGGAPGASAPSGGFGGAGDAQNNFVQTVTGLPSSSPPNVSLPSAPSLYSPLDPASEAARNRIPAQTDNTGMGAFNQAGLISTGIGAAPTQYAAPGDVTPTGDSTEQAMLRKNLYNQAYQPAAEETQRLGAIQDRELASKLGGAGLASSGAGIGQMMRQTTDRNTQLSNLSGQAASSAAVNAANFVLQGNMANADNYLKTIGLNQTDAQNARSSFLQYLNIQESDLARMDASQRQNLSTALDAWLQQYATLGNIGRQATGTNVGATEGTGSFNLGLGGAGGGS